MPERSRPRKPPDPRHAPVKEMLGKLWKHENPTDTEQPWGPSDAGALGQFLSANPTRTVEEIAELLRNRLRSDDHPPGEPAFMWVKYLTRYLGGPLDKFKQPKRKQDGPAKPNRADAGKAHAVDATSAALERLRGLAGS